MPGLAKEGRSVKRQKEKISTSMQEKKFECEEEGEVLDVTVLVRLCLRVSGLLNILLAPA